MAGNQTNGFDMVIEVSTTTIQNLVSAVFDTDGFLGKLFPSNLILEGFRLSLNFNKPSDIPASAQNPIELLLDLDFKGNIAGQLRIVAGLDVDRSRDNLDMVQINMRDHLFLVQVSVNGLSTGVVNTFVTNKLEKITIPLFPIPVQRGSGNSLNIIRADVKIIDDTTAANQDALGVMLTFGGGTAGNLNAFTSAFARQGAGAAIAIRFGWICRNISPRIESSLGLPAGQFNNCTFNGNHEIRDGVRLTQLRITPTNNSIRLTGRVAKSGFCYEASGNIGANIFVGIEAGELRVRFTTDQPNVNVSIPWYCWLGGAVIGAVLGGVIFGVIGAIVGGILIPLILLIAQTVVESTIQSVADRVTTNIGEVNVTAPLGPVGTILDRAFIDDLTITYNMFPEEYAEIKSEGVLVVSNGRFFDLDNGIVKNNDFSGADLRLLGSGSGRSIKALCGTSIGYGNSPVFTRARRFHLYRFTYGTFNEISFSQVGSYIQIPFVGGVYQTTGRIFAAKTSDGCFSIFQVSQINNSQFSIRYRTYQLESFNVRIKGSFLCNPYLIGFDDVRFSKPEYLDSSVVNRNFAESLQIATNLLKDETPAEIPVSRSMTSPLNSEDSGKPFSEQQLMFAAQPDNAQLRDFLQSKVLEHNRAVGNWTSFADFIKKSKTGIFRAVVDGNVTIAAINWMVDGNPIKPESEGKVKVKGVSFDFISDGMTLTLSSASSTEVDVTIKVTVVTDHGTTLSEIRCIRYKNECKKKVKVIPGFKEYLEKFDVEYGIVKVPARLSNITFAHE